MKTAVGNKLVKFSRTVLALGKRFIGKLLEHFVDPAVDAKAGLLPAGFEKVSEIVDGFGHILNKVHGGSDAAVEILLIQFVKLVGHSDILDI